MQEQYFETIQDKIDALQKLDATQKECLEYVLKNGIALVQGPPGIQFKYDFLRECSANQILLVFNLIIFQKGTGKTFLAVQAIQILVETYCKQKKSKPILVICKRNDTVDTFIEKL